MRSSDRFDPAIIWVSGTENCSATSAGVLASTQPSRVLAMSFERSANSSALRLTSVGYWPHGYTWKNSLMSFTVLPLAVSDTSGPNQPSWSSGVNR